MIIGMIGQTGAGKTTIANYFATDKGFIKLSFASTFKDALYKYLPGCQRQDLDNLKEKEMIRKPFILSAQILHGIFKEYQKHTDQKWSMFQLPLMVRPGYRFKRLYSFKSRMLYKIIRQLIRSGVNDNNKFLIKLKKISNLDSTDFDYHFTTYRKAMEFVGTEFLRYIDNDIHVKKALYNISPDDNYVFDDVRFENEINSILNNGKYNEIIHVIRPNDSKQQSTHISNQVIKVPIAYRIHNIGTINYLLAGSDAILDKIRLYNNIINKEK